MSTPSNPDNHAGAIGGGVIAGIVVIFIAITIAAISYQRRRRSQAVSAGLGATQPISGNGTVAESSIGSPVTMKLYDPNDPTTFPGYQGGPGSPIIPSVSQVPLSSHVRSGSTVEGMQTSLPHPGVYHGLPQPCA